jgi:3-isopropylmalate/(R)-2-methylmalate dehydratase large subunit
MRTESSQETDFMGKTITEKILAAHCGKDSVSPGELVHVDVDVILAHEVTTPPAIEELKKRGMDRVFDPHKIVVTPDHFVPNKDEKSAELSKQLREWVNRHAISHYYEVGRHGICHTLLLEQGHVGPGMIVVCGDSHTCTHGVVGAFGWGVGSTELAAAIATGRVWFEVPETIKVDISGTLQPGVYSKDAMLYVLSQLGVRGALASVLEFTGETIDSLDVEDRVTMTNMAVEAGATVGMINPDEKTMRYLAERTNTSFPMICSDANASYAREHAFEVSTIEPYVAVPPLPSNGQGVSQVEGISIDQGIIGSCTNGRIRDLREAANILQGRSVASSVRLIIIPATMQIWKQASREGLLDVFVEAGAAISTPTCGPCLGSHMGVLAAGEVAIASTNRNFVGRMGSPDSEVYLASPATVAASAVRGEISDPRQFMGERA